MVHLQFPGAERVGTGQTPFCIVSTGKNVGLTATYRNRLYDKIARPKSVDGVMPDWLRSAALRTLTKGGLGFTLVDESYSFAQASGLGASHIASSPGSSTPSSLGANNAGMPSRAVICMSTTC